MINPINQYLELWREHKATLNQGSPARLNTLRGEAADALQGEELPRLGDESYVYTSPRDMFAPDYGVNISRINAQADVAAAFKCDVPGISSLLAVTVNDTFHPTDALLNRLPQGVTVCSLRNAAAQCPEILEKHLGTQAQLTNPATAINALLAQDGVLVHVAAGVKLEKPLQLVNIFAAVRPVMGVRRVLIVLEEGAEASILVCDHTQTPGVDFLSSEVTEVSLAPGASLSYYHLESSTPTTTRHSDFFATQHDGSQLRVGSFTLACGTTRNNFNIDIRGRRCETTLAGLATAAAEMRVDNNSRVNHLSPKSHSRQLFKYLVDGNARGAFEGRILVTPGADLTEAYQSNRNILASSSARMHTEPQLEIYCDDVKCSHGAATGQLDNEALFYMRTRGIPEHEARIMLMQAFMADVIELVDIPTLQQRLTHLVERQLAGETDYCGDCAVRK